MEENRNQDIRRLLKTFGVKADAAIQEYFNQNPQIDDLHVRVVLEDLSEHGSLPNAVPLHLEVEGEIRR